MAHSKEAMAKKAAMSQFNGGHWEKKYDGTMAADGKYNAGEFSQPEEYKKSVDALASYARRHKAQH